MSAIMEEEKDNTNDGVDHGVIKIETCSTQEEKEKDRGGAERQDQETEDTMEQDHEEEGDQEPTGRGGQEQEREDQEMGHTAMREGEGEGEKKEDENDEERDEETQEEENPMKNRSINERNRPPEAGIVKKIDVENFMCHRRLEVNLCRNVNFIHGQNGSGKSAILAALQICLGAGARRTNRARNLKELIRKEAPEGAHAKVRVTLLNGGTDAFQPELFGDKITIERQISKGSGYNGYKLYDANMKEISRSKKDLDALLDQLNVQVENPVAVLDQEEAKKFLTGKAEDKYNFFTKATELERIDRKYASILDTIGDLYDQKEIVESSIKASYEKVRELKREYQKFQELEVLEAKISEFTCYQSWALYHAVEKDLTAAEEQLRTALQKKEQRQAELTQQEEMTADEDEQGRRQEIIKNLMQEADLAAQRKHELEKEVKLARNPIRAKAREVEQINKHFRESQRRLHKAKKALQAERQRIVEGAAQSEQGRRLAKIQAFEQELNALGPQLSSATEQKTQNHRLYEENKPVLDNMKKRIDNIRSQIGAVEFRIRELQGSTGDLLSVFGRMVPKVKKMVMRYIQAKKFQGKVVGPIGICIKIVAGKEEFASIAELALGGGMLDRFIVTNDHDRRLLQKIRQECGCSHRECGILQTYDDARFRIPASPTPEVETVASVLQIQDDLVFNCLVDNSRIDTKALAGSKEISERALLVRGNQNSIRGGVKEVYFLPDGDMWSVVKGNLQMRSNEKRLKKTIGVDNEAAVSDGKIELEQLRGDLQSQQREFNSKKSEVEGYTKRWNLASRSIRDIDEKKEELEGKLDALRAEEESAANDMVDNTAELEEDVSNIEEDLRQLRESEEQKRKEIEELQGPLKDAEERLGVVHARNEKVLSDMEKAEQSMQRFILDLSQRQQEMEKKKKKLQKMEEVIQSLEQNRSDAEENRDKALSMARKVQFHYNFDSEQRSKENGDEGVITEQMVSPEPTDADLASIEPIEVERGADFYEGKIKKAQSTLERERKNQNIGDKAKEVAYAHYVNARNKLKSQREQMLAITENADNLSQDLKERRKMWKRFRKHLVDSTANTFDEILQLKGSSGDLSFNHEEKTLDLVVQKDNSNQQSQTKDVKALSGGERSFTTLALLLALGERLETPFRVMDEFDVFLDPVNRRIALKTMVSIATEMEHRQFIFITPQDLSALTESNQLKIIRMRPPKRKGSAEAVSQTTID